MQRNPIQQQSNTEVAESEAAGPGNTWLIASGWLKKTGQGVLPLIQICLQTAYLLPDILLVGVKVIYEREHVPENHCQCAKTDERFCSLDAVFRLDISRYNLSQHRDRNIILRS